MFKRVKEILIAPKTEWTAIEGENTPYMKLFMSYVLPLSFIPAIAAFIGYGIIGTRFMGVHFHSIGFGIRQAVVQWVAMVAGVFLTAAIINLLADSFGAKKNYDRAFALVAYSYTPMFLAGIFLLLPSLSWLAMLAGLYGLYILYLGMKPMMGVSDEKNTVYFIISLVATIVVTGVLMAILGSILLRGAMTVGGF